MYVELHTHSCFSLLDGASRPEALVARVAGLGMPALALTDTDALYGAVSFWQAANEAGVKPIFGAEVTMEPLPQPLPAAERGAGVGRQPLPQPLPAAERGAGVGREPLPQPLPAAERGAGAGRSSKSFGVSGSPFPPREGGWGGRFPLLAETHTGYANLSQLITKARLRSAKGQALVTWEDLAAHRAGLIALSGGRQGAIAQHLLAGRFEAAQLVARRFKELFGPDHFFIELQRQGRPGDEWLTQALLALAERENLPVVATNDVHYATRDGHRLHDVLVAIRHLATLEESHHQRRGNSEAHLKNAAEMARLFADRPDALAHTLEIAARCNVTLHHGVQDLPKFPVPSAFAGAEEQSTYLRWLCQAALIQRFGAEPGARARNALDHELSVIGRLGLANYFLIVWDIMRFGRSQGIRCQGRGSAANSLVAYLLEITPIDPLVHDLVFERFLSQERPGLPDIDIDFDALRREEVIQYVYQRYGRDHAAMACTFVTFQSRSAIRDVGRSLEFPPDLIDAAGQLVNWGIGRGGKAEIWKCRKAQSRNPPIPQLHPIYQFTNLPIASAIV